MTDKYETGYARPPASGQFKPGQSGNNKGRPKGSTNKTLASILDKELHTKLKLKDGTSITAKEAIAKKTVQEMLKSNNLTKLQSALAFISKLESVSDEDMLAKDFLSRMVESDLIDKKDAEDFVRRRRDPNFNFPPAIRKLYSNYTSKKFKNWEAIRYMVLLSYIQEIIKISEPLKSFQSLIEREYSFWMVINHVLDTYDLSETDKKSIEDLIQKTRRYIRPSKDIKHDFEMLLEIQNHNLEWCFTTIKNTIMALPLYEENRRDFLDKDKLKEWATNQKDFAGIDFDEFYADLINRANDFSKPEKSALKLIEAQDLENRVYDFINVRFKKSKNTRNAASAEQEILKKYNIKIKIPDEFDIFY